MSEHVADVAHRRAQRADVPWDDEDGRVVIRRRKFGPVGTAFLRLFRVRPELVLRLDPLGSEVWRLLDGRTVGEVLSALEAEHPEQDDLPQRLGRYLGTLVSNGLVRLD